MCCIVNWVKHLIRLSSAPAIYYYNTYSTLCAGWMPTSSVARTMSTIWIMHVYCTHIAVPGLLPGPVALIWPIQPWPYLENTNINLRQFLIYINKPRLSCSSSLCTAIGCVHNIFQQRAKIIWEGFYKSRIRINLIVYCVGGPAEALLTTFTAIIPVAVEDSRV